MPAALGVGALIVLPRVEFAGVPNPTAAATANTGDSTSAAAQIARAYGTVIPSNVEPAIPAAALAPPVPQESLGAAAPPAPAAPAAPAAAAAAQPASAKPQPAPPANAAAPPLSSAAGQLQGTLLEPELASAALNAKERYFVYIPPDPQKRGQRVPVLYMLHGGGGRREWIEYGLIGMADKAIAAGTLPPMIIVLPQGDQGYWVNHTDGGPKWGDYLARDLVQQVDATYLTLPDARHRAVGGLSMGGWGALYQALSHPDEFGVVGAHAPSLRGGDGSMPFLPRGSGFSQYDPLWLASNASAIDGLRVWLDADEQDPWVKPDTDLHNRLDQRRVANEWHIYPGRHGGTYWHDHIPDYLQFYGRALASP
jgi:enterochelin esterase-like enzyme